MLLKTKDSHSGGLAENAAAARLLRNVSPQVAVSGLLLLIAGGLVGYFVRGQVDNPAVEVVNNTAITAKDFARQSELAAGDQVLKKLTNDELTLQLAQKLGVSPSQSDIDAEYAKLSKQNGFDAQLAASGQTSDDIKHSISVTLAKQNIIDKGVSVTPADIQAYYDVNANPNNPNAQFAQPDRVQIAAIITPDDASHEAALHDLASGASFATTAQKYSRDTSASNGGVLPIIRRGSLNTSKFPGLENQLFSLSPGQQIDTYRTSNSYWVIRCIGKQSAFVTPFSQVKSQCSLGALLAKGVQTNGGNLPSEMQSLTQSSQITVFWPQKKVIAGSH